MKDDGRGDLNYFIFVAMKCFRFAIISFINFAHNLHLRNWLSACKKWILRRRKRPTVVDRTCIQCVRIIEFCILTALARCCQSLKELKLCNNVVVTKILIKKLSIEQWAIIVDLFNRNETDVLKGRTRMC